MKLTVLDLPAQKRTLSRISVLSSAGTIRDSVSMARDRASAIGKARYLWSGFKGARGDSWVTPSVGDTQWFPMNRSRESCLNPSAKLFL